LRLRGGNHVLDVTKLLVMVAMQLLQDWDCFVISNLSGFAQWLKREEQQDRRDYVAEDKIPVDHALHFA
jgi:hypothetical protein